MLADARRLPLGSPIRADVCVIGAGPAGITTALELGRRGVQVVLVEAGGMQERRHEDTYRGMIDSDGGSSRDIHPPLETLRQRAFGGTTWSWGGRCAPLGELEFRGRPHVSLPGWPISRDELLPFYLRAHDYLQLGKFEYSALEAIPGGPPFLLQESQASGLFSDAELFRYSPPTKFGKVFAPAIAREPSIRAYHHANALRLEVDPEGHRVVRAVLASRPGRLITVEASDYVLATGGLEAVRLLLASARDSRMPFGSGFEWAGKGYMTHLDGVVGRVQFRAQAPRAAYAYELSRDGVYCRRLIRLRDQAQLEHGLLNLGSVVYIPEPRDPSHGDPVLSAFATAKHVMTSARLGPLTKRKRVADRRPFPARGHLLNMARKPLPLVAFGVGWAARRWPTARRLPSFLRRCDEYRLLFSAEQAPSPASTVGLSDDLDAFGVPRLKVRWRVSPGDYESVVRTLDLIAREFSRLGLGSLEVPPSADALAAQLDGGFVAGTHAMGLARMSDSPRSGVVDRHCRVHGVPNVYVASSAVFPTGGFAPPTLTVVALAVRIADAIGRVRSPGVLRAVD